MFLNLGFFFIRCIPYKQTSYDSINLGFSELNRIYNDNKKIYVYTKDFDGVMYNIKDRINNFEIINNIDEFDKDRYQRIQGIYLDAVEVYVENDCDGNC